MHVDVIVPENPVAVLVALRYSRGPSTVPVWVVQVARCSACEIAWHRWEQPAAAVCGVVPVAAIVLVFPALKRQPAL